MAQIGWKRANICMMQLKTRDAAECCFAIQVNHFTIASTSSTCTESLIEQETLANCSVSRKVVANCSCLHFFELLITLLSLSLFLSLSQFSIYLCIDSSNRSPAICRFSSLVLHTKVNSVESLVLDFMTGHATLEQGKERASLG